MAGVGRDARTLQARPAGRARRGNSTLRACSSTNCSLGAANGGPRLAARRPPTLSLPLTHLPVRQGRHAGQQGHRQGDPAGGGVAAGHMKRERKVWSGAFACFLLSLALTPALARAREGEGGCGERGYKPRLCRRRPAVCVRGRRAPEGRRHGTGRGAKRSERVETSPLPPSDCSSLTSSILTSPLVALCHSQWPAREAAPPACWPT